MERRMISLGLIEIRLRVCWSGLTSGRNPSTPPCDRCRNWQGCGKIGRVDLKIKVSTSRTMLTATAPRSIPGTFSASCWCSVAPRLPTRPEPAKPDQHHSRTEHLDLSTRSAARVELAKASLPNLMVSIERLEWKHAGRVLSEMKVEFL